MASTMAMLALALRAFVGRNRMGMAAKTNLVAQLVFDIQDDHNHTKSSWLLLNCHPSVNHFTLLADKKLPQKMLWDPLVRGW